jgi:hypothetical protein
MIDLIRSSNRNWCASPLDDLIIRYLDMVQRQYRQHPATCSLIISQPVESSSTLEKHLSNTQVSVILSPNCLIHFLPR